MSRKKKRRRSVQIEAAPVSLSPLAYVAIVYGAEDIARMASWGERRAVEAVRDAWAERPQ